MYEGKRRKKRGRKKEKRRKERKKEKRKNKGEKKKEIFFVELCVPIPKQARGERRAEGAARSGKIV